MASTTSDSPPPSPAAPASAFFDDDHQLFLDPPGATSSFFLATSSREPLPPARASSSAAARKPPRKRPRASRRPPTTVLTTDTSNFRAMVQEFTGIPAPPPFAPHLGGPGVLFGVPHHDPAAAAGARSPLGLLMRPSPLKLPAAPHASPPPAGSFAHSLFPSSSNPNNRAGSSSEFYSGFAPTLSGAVPRHDGGGFEFEAAEDESVGHGHGLFSSLLHPSGDRYHSH